MKPGDIRRWKTVHSNRVILIVRIHGARGFHGQKNGYCDYLEGGELREWAPVLDIEVNSEAIDGQG